MVLFEEGGVLTELVVRLHGPTALRRELEELREESRRLDEAGEREEEEAVPSAA